MSNRLAARVKIKKTLNSGAALSCRYVKFRFNYAPLDSVQGFDLYKLVDGNFVNLSHGANADWVMESHRDGNWYLMIRNTDASRSGPEMLNGIYVFRNRDTRKGKVITIRKTDEACDDPTELVYASFVDMNSAPYVSTISLRITGKIEERLTLNVLDKDENELASVVGGARQKRGQTELDSVTNANLEAKVVCTSSPCVYIADLLTEDGVFYLNDADDISITNDNPNFTQAVTMRTIRETLRNKDRSRSENADATTNTATNTTTNTSTNTQRPPPSRNPVEDPRVAALEASLAAQAEQNRRIMERLNQNSQPQVQEEESGIDNTTKALIAIVALGGAFLIYKKMQAKKQQSQ